MPSRRALRRSFKVMPIWMRGGNPEEMFEGAVSSLGYISFLARDASEENAIWALYKTRDQRVADFATQLGNDPSEIEHTLGNAFDALDAVIRLGHRAHEAEQLLELTIAMRKAVRAADAEGLIAVCSSFDAVWGKRR